MVQEFHVIDHVGTIFIGVGQGILFLLFGEIVLKDIFEQEIRGIEGEQHRFGQHEEEYRETAVP